MILWLDAQLSPALAPWLREQFGITVEAIRDLGLRDASDVEIFQSAKQSRATIVTKDADFLHFLFQQGPPPQILWITCGNTSNAKLKDVLSRNLSQALIMLERGEPLVEIGDG
ncbi:MAG: DUF5615 family PIN-like protein [Magnetococcales bacterium]|nr:DUF5615 family PIN-like protein [Magnetococcales bacterium]